MCLNILVDLGTRFQTKSLTHLDLASSDEQSP